MIARLVWGSILLTTLITGCTPTSQTRTSEPQPETEQADPQPDPTADGSVDPELLRQCMMIFEEPSGEALFMCDRYQIMVLPVAPGSDPQSIFALRIEEAKAILGVMGKANVVVDALAEPPNRAGESAASYRLAFDGGPSNHPIPLVMLLSETDGEPKMVYGIGNKAPTELSFEERLAACTGFVRAIHDADDPKSQVASEDEFTAMHAKDQAEQTPYQKMFAELHAITEKACACEPKSACQRAAAAEFDAFVKKPKQGASPKTSEDNERFFAELERACACTGVEC